MAAELDVKVVPDEPFQRSGRRFGLGPSSTQELVEIGQGDQPAVPESGRLPIEIGALIGVPDPGEALLVGTSRTRSTAPGPAGARGCLTTIGGSGAPRRAHLGRRRQ